MHRPSVRGSAWLGRFWLPSRTLRAGRLLRDARSRSASGIYITIPDGRTVAYSPAMPSAKLTADSRSYWWVDAFLFSENPLPCAERGTSSRGRGTEEEVL